MAGNEDRAVRSEGSSLPPSLWLPLPPFIRHVEIHNALPSTNDRATQLAMFAALETPALVVARRQLEGRGRGMHAWWSTDGALTFSLILAPASWGIPPDQWPRLSLTTAVAVCDAMEATCDTPGSPLPAPCSIKWPNDVLIDGKKIAGILLESPGGPAPAKDRLVIGVGINVNNSWQGAPREAGSNGTALCDVTDNQHDLQTILIGFLQALELRLHQLGRNDPELPRAWQQRSWLADQHVEVDNGGRKIEGLCVGIADDGALLIQTTLTTECIYNGSARVIP
jgi:BirA family biotin operon repressor/biotin-[acetyl-CoA-carboxylase] ligase